MQKLRQPERFKFIQLTVLQENNDLLTDKVSVFADKRSDEVQGDDMVCRYVVTFEKLKDPADSPLRMKVLAGYVPEVGAGLVPHPLFLLGHVTLKRAEIP